MTIKMKLAALAALAALTAPAFAAGNLAATANLLDADLLGGTEAPAVLADATAGTIFTDTTGNTAVVTQVTSSNVAYVEQTADVLNIAFVSQSVADDNAAAVYQAGGSNRAAIYQH